MKRAALYLRSSKDRSDVSLDAQRRALKELAAARGHTITAEFADAVESGKDDDRPGFQSLIRAVRDPRRGWDTLLVHDTSRLARRRVLAIIFEEADCKRAGVSIVYKSVPDSDPITEMMLKSILQAMDEWHSLTSKQKGLAGMAENVRQGYRAGGRAPRGYRLRQIHTGAVRGGEPVSKTVLEPDDEAPTVGRYLSARAAGLPAKRAADEAGLTAAASTLVGLEWNALTYAGNTVWNVHAERSEGGYVGGHKRRPRADWVVQAGTHPALITQEEADALLARLEGKQAQWRRSARHRSGALLSGLLVAPTGQKWHSDGAVDGGYRVDLGTRTRRVRGSAIDEAVLAQVYRDLKSPKLVSALVVSTRALLASGDGKQALEAARKALSEVERRISRQMELAEQMRNPAPALRKIEELEGMRAEQAQEVGRREREVAQAEAAGHVTEKDVRHMLDWLLAQRGDDSRDLLVALVERVVLDPETLAGEVHYRLGGGGGKPDSGLRGTLGGIESNPRGDANLSPRPVLRAVVGFQVVAGQRRHL